MKTLSRTEEFAAHGVSLRNPRWSWGGYNQAGSVYIQLWAKHLREDGTVLAFSPRWKNRNGGALPGAAERKQMLEEIAAGKPGFGILAEGEKPDGHTMLTTEFVGSPRAIGAVIFEASGNVYVRF